MSDAEEDKHGGKDGHLSGETEFILKEGYHWLGNSHRRGKTGKKEENKPDKAKELTHREIGKDGRQTNKGEIEGPAGGDGLGGGDTKEGRCRRNGDRATEDDFRQLVKRRGG